MVKKPKNNILQSIMESVAENGSPLDIALNQEEEINDPDEEEAQDI